MPLYIYEILYRGRPVGSEESPAVHVVLADTTKDAFGNENTSLSSAMSVEKAASLGFDVPDLAAGVNVRLAAEVAALSKQIDAAKAEIEALTAGESRVV